MWSLLAWCWSVLPVKAPFLEPSITDVARGGPAIFGSIYLPYSVLLHGLFRDFAKYAYYRISRRHLLTDGTKHLAEQGACFWMMDAVASHLSEIGTRDWFVLVRVSVTEGRAVMVYEDGNDHELARQEIPYTDFPLEAITLYACWDTQHWVIMLPSEY